MVKCCIRIRKALVRILRRHNIKEIYPFTYID